MAAGFQHVDQVKEALEKPHGEGGAAFERVQILHGSTYKDASTVVIMPTRDPLVHHQVWTRFMTMMAPMNQKRHMMICCGDEDGIAYNRMIADLLTHPDISKWKYVMTVESDNLVPADAHIRLVESIERYGFDGVSGIYFTKGEINMPMAYGNAERFRQGGELEFQPLDIAQMLNRGDVVEVNGIAMGCSLYRMDLFREIPAPWFVTMADVTPAGPMAFTQDLWFCKQAKSKGKRFGVDMRVKVGHLDLASGEVY